MERTVRDVLIKALDNLTEQNFTRFRNKLSDWEIKKGFNIIPKAKLEKADREDVVDLILSHYMDSYGPELTVDVLESINESQVALELRKDLENELTEMKHFVDRYREELIQRISLIDPILYDLMTSRLLTSEECDRIRAQPTPQDKMRSLYSVIRGWSNTEKDILYILLKEYYSSMTGDLLERELTEKEHFVDRHRWALIYRIHLIDPILDGLMTRSLLTSEECDRIRAEPTPQDKMKSLYSVTRWWSNTEKDILYNLLKEHNSSVIGDLLERDTDTSVYELRHKYYAWRHKYEDMCTPVKEEAWGRRVEDYASAWGRRELTEKKHFVDRYREELIQRIPLIDPILDDLMARSLLTSEQCDTIRAEPTPQEKMRRLYSVIGRWSNTDKDILYNILKKHNSSVIGDLEKRVYGISHKPGSSLDVTSVRWKGDGHSGTQSQAFCSESFQSPGEVLKISSHLDEIDCDLCGKDHDPDDTLVFPDIYGKSYRLELTSAGLFRCSEMGIKFQVKGPVTIEYELDSWDNYIAYLQHQGSEVLGPLFNIKTPQEPHIVCAVYLPHYLCFKELSEDTSWIRCAHFIDGNMSVEKPTRILPFHVVLENPSFSSLGVFCWNALPSAVTKRIPIHGRVLLYFRVIGKTSEEYQLHLYLVPRFAPISKDLEKEKQEMGYVKVDKPPRTRRTIYTEKKYIVKGPDEAFIDPKELDVRCISPKENFTDITIHAAVKTFGLDLVQEDSEDKVWGCHMSTGTIEQLWSDWEKNKRPEVKDFTLSETPKEETQSTSEASSSSASKTQEEHFVDKHRKELIAKCALVEPILDGLLPEGLLSQQQYDAIRAEKYAQEKMRKLYEFIKGWSETNKQTLYNILKKENRPLIENLEQS